LLLDVTDSEASTDNEEHGEENVNGEKDDFSTEGELVSNCLPDFYHILTYFFSGVLWHPRTIAR